MSEKNTDVSPKFQRIRKGAQRSPEEVAAIQREFVAAVAETGVMVRSATKLGLSYAVIENYRRTHPEFDVAVREAQRKFGERLEAEAIRRGATGFKKPVFYKGQQVAEVTEYSDPLLLAALKKHVPEYRERITADVNLRGGVLVVPGVAPTEADWAESHGTKIEEPEEGDEDSGTAERG